MPIQHLLRRLQLWIQWQQFSHLSVTQEMGFLEISRGVTLWRSTCIALYLPPGEITFTWFWRQERRFHLVFVIFRSTPASRPNNISGSQMSVHPYVRPSTKSFFDFNEIWYVGRGRRVMHDGMQYDPIRGQGQGHEPMKVGNSTIFKVFLLPHL